MVQQSIIHRIESLKQELAALQPMTKEAEDALWKKLRLEWNYNSNHIEGNTLTYGETKLLLMFDKTTGDHSKREYDEMEAHDAAVLMVQDWAQDRSRSLTETDIRELNKMILVKPFWKEAITPDGQSTRRKIKIGDYKEHPNSVRLPNGEMFHYTKPENVAIEMRELMDWYRSSSDLDPVILAAELHYRFIRIHPFDDGNGRVARILVNYVLMLNDLPPVVIKSAEKEKYLTALQKADVGDRDAFHSYMAEQLIWSLELSIKAAKGEDLEEEGDWKKKAIQLERELKTKPKVILKSNTVMQKVMNEVYIPFLSTSRNNLKTIDALFRTTSWHLRADHEHDGTYRSLIPLMGIPGPSQKFDEILQEISESFEKRKESGFYYHTQVFHRNRFFGQNDDGFECCCKFDIDFFDKEFVIKLSVGTMQDLSKFGEIKREFQKIANDSSKPLEVVGMEIVRMNYNQLPEGIDIQTWSNRVGKVVFDWVEAKATEGQGK